MSDPLIIGIHGLANKPPEDVLSVFWEKSIAEGLEKNLSMADPQAPFEMVYWADKLYKTPLHDDKAFHFDALFNTEPYVPAFPKSLERKEDSKWDGFKSAALDLGGESLDFLKERFGFNSLADAFLGKLLKDLNFYYKDKTIQRKLRSHLTEKLLAAKDRRIMLVAHSMGSIVAYDVLTLLGQTHPRFKVDQFVTIGSPLGLPHVKGKIIKEFTHRGAENERVRTPTVVRGGWTNFADRKDPVALDVHLSDDYAANKHKIRCRDDLVFNDYRIKKKGEKKADRNYHKSYGYLRTPEFSELTKSFLNGC